MACRLDDRINLPDIRLVGMVNVVVPVDVVQKAARAAHENSDDDCLEFTRELQARRDLLMEELAGLPVGVPADGWSFMLLVVNGREALKALMEERINVTSMDGWAETHGASFVELVFSQEPCHRLECIARKVRAALGRCRVEPNAAEAQ
jgi:N-succinyldiaminopimelate aminotransferase